MYLRHNRSISRHKQQMLRSVYGPDILCFLRHNKPYVFVAISSLQLLTVLDIFHDSVVKLLSGVRVYVLCFVSLAFYKYNMMLI